MSDKKLSVFQCPECGEQERTAATGEIDSRWRRWPRFKHQSAPVSVRHWHGEEDRGKPGEFVEAEEVEVIPVDRLLSDETVEAVARIPWDNDFPGAWDKGIDPEDEEEPDPRLSARADVRSCLEAAIKAAEERG